MQRRLVAVVRPHLHHVGDIHDQRTRQRIDANPAVRGTDLEPSDVGLRDQGERSCIAMAIHPELSTGGDVVRIGGRRVGTAGVVIQPDEARMVRPKESMQTVSG